MFDAIATKQANGVVPRQGMCKVEGQLLDVLELTFLMTYCGSRNGTGGSSQM